MTEQVRDASVWSAADFAEPRAWVRPFTDEMVAEVDGAIEAAARAGLDFHSLTPETFPLPVTAPMLASALEDLESGPGFAVLGGFPTDRYDLDEQLLAFGGLSSHLGAVVPQTHKDERIIEVTDRDKPYDHTSRGYHSNQLLPFHTDGADYAGLMVLGMAAEGGRSVIASAPAVHNTILSERPDLWDVLNRGYLHHRRGEELPGEPPVSDERIPVFAFHDGLLHTMYNRNPIDWVTRAGYTLSEIEIEALDFLDAVVARPELQLSMEMQTGDIQLINNFVIFHSRTGYRDSADQIRHLLRIWISNDTSVRTGPTLLDLYNPNSARTRRAS